MTFSALFNKDESKGCMSSLYLSKKPSTSLRLETAGIVLAALFSPLWFLTVGGVNLIPTDFILLAVFALFIYRTGILPFSPSRKTSIATFAFLFIAGLSIFWTPRPLPGLLNFAQYLFIFVGVVPLTSHYLRNRRTRWKVFIAVCISTNILSLIAATTFLLGDVDQLRDITLWYGNQNQLFWLVASAWICNVSIAIERSKHGLTRLGAGLLVLLQTWLIVGGMTLSAILILVSGGWAFAAWLTSRRSRRATATLLYVTIGASGVALVLIAQNWETLYIQGSLHVRIPQYLTAIEQGIIHFPLGAGIESSAVVMDSYPSPITSIHNFILAYFVELGVVGMIAFLAIIVVWIRDVFISALWHPFRLRPFEFAFIVIFATYVLVIMFQPVPVHRYWWFMFGASWAIAHDSFFNEGSLHS